MYKVLVVDDFYVDRHNISDIIRSFTSIDLEIVGECENGKEAIEMIGNLKPDIVISDIEMPLMNGLELAKCIRMNYPDIKIVFCSLYNEFSYVREALYLENYGYVLKPINPSELEECLKKVCGVFTNNLHTNFIANKQRCMLLESKTVMVESFLKTLVFGLNPNDSNIWDKIEYLGIDLSKGTYILSLIEIDDFNNITYNYSIEQIQIFSLRVFEKIKAIIGLDSNAVLLKVDEIRILIIFSYNDSCIIDDCSKHANIISTSIINEFNNTDISLSLAISGSIGNVCLLKELFEQCRYLLKYKYSLGKGRIISVKDIPENIECVDIDFNAIQKEIRFLLNSGDGKQINEYIQKLYCEVLANTGEAYLKNICFYIIISAQNVLSESNINFQEIFDHENIWEKLLKFETIEDAKDWIICILTLISEHISKNAGKRNMKIVEEVKLFIEKCDVKNLSLEIIADHLHYSPNYINILFKKATGETIFDYTNKFKIENAKELLKVPGLKLYEIAEKLGYSHSVYFNNVFRKYTGLSPKDYRERGL